MRWISNVSIDSIAMLRCGQVNSFHIWRTSRHRRRAAAATSNAWAWDSQLAGCIAVIVEPTTATLEERCYCHFYVTYLKWEKQLKDSSPVYTSQYPIQQIQRQANRHLVFDWFHKLNTYIRYVKCALQGRALYPPVVDISLPVPH